MAVRMRLTRVGSKKNPIYRVVVADSRSPRDGKFIEIVGRYNPQHDPSLIEFDEAKVKDWLSKGAQPSQTVSRLLKAKNIVVSAGRPSSSSTWRGGSSRSRTRCGSRSSTRTTRTCSSSTSPSDDLGSVIGRGGRIARAMRTLVRAGGAHGDRRVLLEIVE